MNAPNASRKQKVYFLHQDWDQSLCPYIQGADPDYDPKETVWGCGPGLY